MWWFLNIYHVSLPEYAYRFYLSSLTGLKLDVAVAQYAYTVVRILVNLRLSDAHSTGRQRHQLSSRPAASVV